MQFAIRRERQGASPMALTLFLVEWFGREEVVKNSCTGYGCNAFVPKGHLLPSPV